MPLNNSLNNFNPLDKKDVDEINKIKNYIFFAIKKIDLDLSGLTVITEAATGPWKYTPFIAAFANANKIICYAKDSKYGSKKEIKENFEKISNFFGLQNKIFVFDLPL